MRKVVDREGTIRYFNKQGQYCRENGPAIECSDGSKFWFINGDYHRLDGPAVDFASGYKEYWIDGIELTEQEFWARPEVLLYWIVNLSVCK